MTHRVSLSVEPKAKIVEKPSHGLGPPTANDGSRTRTIVAKVAAVGKATCETEFSPLRMQITTDGPEQVFGLNK